MDAGQTFAIALGIFLVLWFLAASAYNRRRGVRTYRWIQSGVKTLGAISEARWLGSSGSGAQMVIAKPGKPYRRIEIAFLLETRELLPLWLLNRLRGRRDYMIFKANLRSAPRGDVEILPQDSRRFRSIENPPGKEAWSVLDRPLAGGFAAAQRGRDTDQLIESVTPLLSTDGESFRRLSLARTPPHLITEINLPDLMAAPASDFFARLSAAFSEKPGEVTETPDS